VLDEVVELFPTEEEAKIVQDNKIYECRFQHDEWRIYKPRTDKSTPNASYVFERIWKSIEDNVTKLEVINFRSAPSKRAPTNT
jgi:hypothetical protein